MNLIKAPIDMMLNPLHLKTGVDAKGRFKELPATPNCVSTQTVQAKKRVPALPYVGTREESKAKIKAALEAMPDTIKYKKEKDDYLYVIFVSNGLKFKDDVEFYFDDKTQKVEFRSCSRIGYSDMGVNRKRYDTIKANYCG